ncbi:MULTISPECIES: carboxylating nicotinate-nucleotide diphosphorylase [unclassified Corynebacterium]|uniref:carboxylating nicotinate-nucleotide diphosphorylase n=1 Tax=unclassified Corynebacterium TaxID=2624378 RepID=UPI0035248909
MYPTAVQINGIIDNALSEDAPWGDITSETLIPSDARATATLTAREDGVFSGGPVFAATFQRVDPATCVVLRVTDGTGFRSGDILAKVSGTARSVLRAERVGLNFVQRMSGIATLTDRYVTAVDGTGARIVDTRKTTPGLRVLEKKAVRDGGGHNHRATLSDAVMVKDNHLTVLTAGGLSVTETLRQMRERLPHTTHIEVEVDRLDQIPAVLAAGVDTIMLDNFTLYQLRAGVAAIGGAALVEASGGIDLTTVREVAATGVDLISVGSLTHSARAIDLGLDITVCPDERQ